MLVFWKIWRASFACNRRFETRPFALFATTTRRRLYYGVFTEKVYQTSFVCMPFRNPFQAPQRNLKIKT